MKVAYGSYANMKRNEGEAFDFNEQNTFPLINLHVSANNLKDLDIITVSDPICVMYIWDGKIWSEFARTEVVWNNLNPEWVQFFTVMYVFEMRQPLKFRVYDVDSPSADLSRHDFIGEAEIELSQIITGDGTTKLELHVPKKDEVRGILNITQEQVENSATVVKGVIECSELRKVHFTGNKPFFVISKSSESGKWLPIYKSEVNKKMKFKRFSISYQVLCNLDQDRPIKITFFHNRSFKSDKEIGFHETTFSRISEQQGQILTLVDNDNKCVGKFKAIDISLQQGFTFYDYLRGGIQLNLITAIDFTGSNGDPRKRSSRHYIDTTGDYINEYERCIKAIGEVLCPYDSDQMFPVYGFGAEVNNRTSHCFPLTFNENNDCVKGLDGILKSYHDALRKISLSGPTYFSEVIRNATQTAVESFASDKTYTILLIITDGMINDMNQTIDAIVDAGKKPISIIIVGVGDSDFDAMNVLDADDVPLVSSKRVKMCRDLVQFVPFTQFADKHYSILASEVLEEIPRQLIEWAELNGVRPNNQ